MSIANQMGKAVGLRQEMPGAGLTMGNDAYGGLRALAAPPGDAAPILTPRPLYQQDFSTSADGWLYNTQLNGTQDFVSHGDDGGGNGYLVSSGPWWVDPNHAPPGGGYLHLLAIRYVRDDFTPSEFTDIEIDFDVKVQNLFLPPGAELYLWFQSVDPKLPWATGNFVNYVNIANPISPLLDSNGEAHVHIQFTTTDSDWLALSSSVAREELYSVSATIADALSGTPADMGLIILLGGSIPNPDASGTVQIDNVTIDREGPMRAAIAANEPGVLQPLLLSVDLSDADDATFNGGALVVSQVDGGTVGTIGLSQTLGNGLTMSGGQLFLSGNAIGTVGGGTGGNPLDIHFTADVTDAQVETVIGSLAFASGDGVAESVNDLRLDFFDPAGADTTLDVLVRVRAALPDGSGVDIASGTDRSEALRGGGGNDQLKGLGGDDRLDGGTGVDDLSGGTGNDTYWVDNARDKVTENPGEGDDRVFATASWAMGASQEIETLSTDSYDSTAPINLDGSDLANFIMGNAAANVLSGWGGNDTIVGNAGADRLIGGAGADYMNGGFGDDWYFVDNKNDQVFELPGQGNDRVLATASFALGGGQEVETLSTDYSPGTAAIDLDGNGFANYIMGNAGANKLNGWAGNDTIVGYAGDDTLVGGAGADYMNGGAGDDLFHVDNAGDQVFEKAGEGNDRVLATVSFVLAAGQEIETLSTDFSPGTAAINLTGNEFANFIQGNAGANILSGLAGNDTIVGNAGSDRLIGGTGADYMNGGAGDDWFFVDNGADQAFELAGEGNDRVFATASFALAAGQEIETLSTDAYNGNAAIDLTGNEFANFIMGNAAGNILAGSGGNDTLVGNAGNDTLTGGAGADYMNGGLGNDWFYVENAGDQAFEKAGEGNDRVFTSISYTLAAGQEIETVSTQLDTGTDAINLTGNELANTLIGNEGANLLDGKGGNDVLTGGGGADTFAFTTPPGGGNVDQVGDFVSGTDKLSLDHAAFTTLAAGALNPSAFVAGTAAADADDRILYDQTTGALYYDADGNGAGAAVQFATLVGHPALTASDFQVI